MVHEPNVRKDVWSPVITFDDNQNAKSDGVMEKQSLKIGTTSYVTLLDKDSNVCYQIVVQSKRCDGILIVVLKERFALRNISTRNVNIVPVMFQKPDPFKVSALILFIFTSNLTFKPRNNLTKSTFEY